MNIPRTHDSSCDLAVQPTVSTLHIPSTSTFIPFPQFSVSSDGSSVRNPADDNNNKTALPVVSVVTAVSGLCPTISVVSMQQPAQITQTVVTPTIIPGVMAPIAVQAGGCLTPTTAMSVANTINITNSLSIPQLQHQPIGNPGFNMKPQVSGIISNVINNNIMGNAHHNATSLPGVKSTTAVSTCSNTTASPPSSSTNTSIPSTNSTTSKPISATSKTPPSSSSQSTNSEQNDDLVKPVFKDGELVLEVECGQNKAVLYLSKLCQGSKGPCISFQSSWLTPNEFQFVSGRETAKDWKRSIRHHGKSLKLLLAKGILNVHPTMCDCDGCRQGATLTRKGEKRRIPNGDRKPRKSNSNNASGGTVDGTAVRQGGGSLLTSHFGSSGLVQVKPEIKRSVGDKPAKMAEAATQSQHPEMEILPPKQGQTFKSASSQRPQTLNTSRDSSQQKAAGSNSNSLPLQSLVPSPAVSTNTSPTLPPNQNSSQATNSLPVANPSFDVPTPNQLQTLPIVALMSPSSYFSTQSSPHASCAITIKAQPSSTSSVTNSLSTATAVAPELPSRHPSSNPGMAEMLSPNLPNLKQAHTPTSSSGCDPTPRADNSSENDRNNNPDEGLTSEENMISNEADDSFNTDDTEDESYEDNSDDFSKSSESKDSTSDDQILIPTSNNENEPDTSQASEINEKPSCFANLSESLPGMKQTAADEEHPEESQTRDPNINNKHDSEHSSTPLSSSSITTLAVSSVSGASSNPISLSISTTNVKSELIWVPPKLQPLKDDHDARHIQQHGSNGAKSPSNMVPHHDNSHTRESHCSTANKDGHKLNTSTKFENQACPRDKEHTRPESLAIKVSQMCKDSHVVERQISQCVHGKDTDAKGDCLDPARAQASHLGSTVNREKNVKDKEREERYRHKLKEERSRREKEERNRKDREREERREREKREEKDSERMRQEEKDRRVQAESKTSKERSTTTPSGDPYRRPPGGVAEAAAFSDYMRVLAAGHGHAFMSPAAGYMSSVFPIRQPEQSLQTHLIHPMAAFSPQLNGMHKDAMMYQASAGVLPQFASPAFGPLHPLLQRPPYASQQSILDYQRSLAAAASYSWPAAYPYFLHDMSASVSSSASTSTSLTAGGKRSSAELEATMEMNAKRMRLESRPTDYASTWDYFTAASAASHQLRVPVMTPSLPCGLESASMDKTAEFLRKRYLEYGPQAAAYLSSLPEYARPGYYCACADHRDDDIRMWSVEDVCKFLGTIEGCAVYAEHFREQRVTGRILSILTPDHLVKTMGMKLGPAVSLSEAVGKKIQDMSKLSNCDACRSMYLNQPIHSMVLPL